MRLTAEEINAIRKAADQLADAETRDTLYGIANVAAGGCHVCRGDGAYMLEGEVTSCRECAGTGRDQQIELQMTEQEFDTTLHALREYQQTRDPQSAGQKDDGYFYRHPALSDIGLDEFIERINTDERLLEPCAGRELTPAEATDALDKWLKGPRRDPMPQPGEK